MEVVGFHREDYYWAQVAAEIRRGNVKNPRNVKVEDFLMKFTTDEKKRPTTPKSSKAAWLGILGISGKD